MKRIAALLMLSAAYPSIAAEAPTVIVTIDDASRPIRDVTLKADTAHQFQYDESDPGEMVRAVRFRHVKRDSIQHQFTQQAAIEMEGPWWTLNGIAADSPWIPVQAKADGTIVLADEMGKDLLGDSASVTLQPTQAQMKQALRKTLPEPGAASNDLWFAALKQCGGNVNTRPCYTYRRVDHLRFTGEDGNAYMLLIMHPGGC